MEEEVGTPTAVAPSLPDEMVFEILVRLPDKNLNRCKCVSKAWRSLITSPRFVQAHRARHPAAGLLVWAVAVDAAFQPFLTNDFYFSPIGFRRPAEPFCRLQPSLPVPGLLGITDVIHGLVCFYNSNHLFVANVFTGEVKELPRTGNSRHYILGFDAVNRVYKLLGLGSSSSEILSLGLGGWRKAADDCVRMQQCRNFVAVNNVMYSMVARQRFRRRGRCYLVSFNLNKEEFRCIKIPRGMTSECLLSHYVVELRGRLALADPKCGQGCGLSLYIMEDDEGNMWSKHHIPLPERLHELSGMSTVPVGNLPDGRTLLCNLSDAEESLLLGTPIYSYDHQTCKFEKLFVGKFPEMHTEAPADLFWIRMLCVVENWTKFDILFDKTRPSRGDIGECGELV